MRDDDRARITEALVAGLTPDQREGVLADERRILIIAGAGAGKTSVLTRRVARLLAKGVPGELILCVTFTRAAAEEMLERIQAFVEQHMPGTRLPEVHTLHAWGARMLRAHADLVGRTREFTIYDDIDHEDVVRAAAAELGIEKAKTKSVRTLWRDQRVQTRYYALLTQGNALNFDQIESLSLRLLREERAVQQRWIGRYRHVLVDEYQDTNLAQVAIVHAIDTPNLCIVGDPRQSIYRFRGAEVSTIIEAARDRGYRVVELTTNFRSVPEVVAFANGCVRPEDGWRPMVSARPSQGDPIQLVEGNGEPLLAADQVQRLLDEGAVPRDIAVIGRNWKALAQVHEALVARGVLCAYHGADDDPWAHEDGRALARALQLTQNPADDNLAALIAEWGAMGAARFGDLRVVKARALRAGTTLLEALAAESPAWAEARRIVDPPDPARTIREVAERWVRAMIGDAYRERNLTSREERLEALIAAADEVGERDVREQEMTPLERFCEWWSTRSIVDVARGDQDGVQITTVHGAKGLEYRHVVAIQCVDGVYPGRRAAGTEQDHAEDLRVFYVLVTRARDTLTCVRSFVAPPAWVGGYEQRTERSPYLSLPGGPAPTSDPVLHGVCPDGATRSLPADARLDRCGDDVRET